MSVNPIGVQLVAELGLEICFASWLGVLLATSVLTLEDIS